MPLLSVGQDFWLPSLICFEPALSFVCVDRMLVCHTVMYVLQHSVLSLSVFREQSPSRLCDCAICDLFGQCSVSVIRCQKCVGRATFRNAESWCFAWASSCWRDLAAEVMLTLRMLTWPDRWGHVNSAKVFFNKCVNRCGFRTTFWNVESWFCVSIFLWTWPCRGGHVNFENVNMAWPLRSC